MKLIKLTRGQFAQVDDEDFEWLNQFKWYALKSGNTFYARRGIKINGRWTCTSMHKMIMGDSKLKLDIDHGDGNGCNNQRDNLKFCTHMENMMNRRIQNNCSSVYKGVSWSKRANKWHGYIRVNKQRRHLGYFIVEEDAARAYDAAAIKYFGGFKRLNFS